MNVSKMIKDIKKMLKRDRFKIVRRDMKRWLNCAYQDLMQCEINDIRNMQIDNQKHFQGARLDVIYHDENPSHSIAIIPKPKIRKTKKR